MFKTNLGAEYRGTLLLLIIMKTLPKSGLKPRLITQEDGKDWKGRGNNLIKKLGLSGSKR